MRRAWRLPVGVLLALLLMAEAAAAQTISWVSVSEDGTVNGASAGSIAVSDDGRLVAFRSSRNGLVPGDNGDNDVFVKDMQTGSLELASVSSGGVKGNGDSGVRADMSGDGRYVAFTSSADNLVPGDTNDRADVFIRDRTAGTTVRVPGTTGSPPVGAATAVAISGNGRYVAFVGAGYEPGFDAGDWGVYVHDRVAGTTERVTDGVNFTTTSGQYEEVDISDDGRYVAFMTGEFGAFDDVILFDRNTDTYEVANPRLGGQRPQSTHPQDLALSANGRFVSFYSPDSNYVNGDPADTTDVFVYSAATDSLERIPDGGTVSQRANPVLSADGRYVAFMAWTDLYDSPTANGRPDIVVYDRQTDTGEVVSRFDDGTIGDSSSGSSLSEAAISRNGRFVAFLTNTDFDPGDSGLNDVYLVDRQGTPGGGVCTDSFTDTGSSIFADDICWLAGEGITKGCTADNTRFCPKNTVTRAQMASFLARAFGLAPVASGPFTDISGSVHAGSINAVYQAGITLGCTPTEFCPNDPVRRDQMASFLARALKLSPVGSGPFTDTSRTVHAGNINAIYVAGVTRGCAANQYCPADPVPREQMAAFLRRALDN